MSDGTMERAPVDVNDLESEGDIAADYIEGLLDIADLDGDIDMDVEGSRAAVSVVGDTLDQLVGEDGEVLEALQELTRMAVHRQTGTRSRLMLDVGGYRARRRAELTDLGEQATEEVKRTGERRELAPMNPFERKVIHDVAAAAGLHSESEGEEPERHVVMLPPDATPSSNAAAPETVPYETAAPETVPYETAAPETVPRETAAPDEPSQKTAPDER